MIHVHFLEFLENQRGWFKIYLSFFIKKHLKNFINLYNINLSFREHFYNKNLNYYISHCSSRNVTSKISSENSPTSSDMADSGLETGSMISPQETVSENSTTDLDEPNEAIVHKSGSISQACQETCFNNIHAHDPSKGIVGINDEISEYENRVLNDPFYESNDESDNDDNHQIHMYMPTTSFQFTEPQSATVNIASGKKIDDSFLKSDQIAQNGKKPNITIEVNKKLSL